MSFKGKIVIVTGSSSGIGASTAIQFTKEGAHVVIVGRNEERLESVGAECEKFGYEPLIIKADVSKETDGKRIIDETIKKHGRIDVLINNAGIAEASDVINDGFMKVYDRIMNVNLRGVIFITHCAIPYLIKSKGNVINISSVAARSTMKGLDIIPYCVSKAGLDHFTRGVALKLATYGVRVNAISPGPVETKILNHHSLDSVTLEDLSKFTALERLSESEEIADLILFVASEKAKGVTGSNFVSDNGYLIRN